MTNQPEYSPLAAYLDADPDSPLDAIDPAIIAACDPHAEIAETAITAMLRLNLPSSALLTFLTSCLDNCHDTANDPDFADDAYPTTFPPMPDQLSS